MRAFFPSQQGVIEETFENISKIVSNNNDRDGRALTLDHGDLIYPTIIYKYSGSVSDTMVIAHEFGHALQIVLSKGRFVSPIVREVCAFSGEAILLKWLQDTDKARHNKFAQVWRSDSRKYFVSDGHVLKLALNDPDASYKYGWNYPIARYLAEHISREFTQERLWMVFQGNLSVRQIIHDLGPGRIGAVVWINNAISSLHILNARPSAQFRGFERVSLASPMKAPTGHSPLGMHQGQTFESIASERAVPNSPSESRWLGRSRHRAPSSPCTKPQGGAPEQDLKITARYISNRLSRLLELDGEGASGHRAADAGPADAY